MKYLKGQYTTIGQTETQAQVKVEPSDDGSSTTSGAPVTSAIQTDVSSIVEKAMPSVVAIQQHYGQCSSRPGSDRVRP
ncbi:MAG: hypothetical protein ACLUD2_02685 [Clostridium sp.]